MSGQPLTPSCADAAEKSASAKLDTVTIGTSRFSLPAGVSRVIKLKLSSVGRLLFKAHREHLRATLASIRASLTPGQTHREKVTLATPPTKHCRQT